MHTAYETPVIRLEEQLAMRSAENSIAYENQMYRIGIPWKESQPILPDNYDMAVRTLKNTVDGCCYRGQANNGNFEGIRYSNV